MRFLAALFALTCASARGDETARHRGAQLLADQGNDAWLKRDYALALERFQEAYQLFPSPKLHYNMALALDALGRTPEAAAEYQQFLDDAEDAPAAARVAAEQKIAELDRSLARLALRVDPDGASVAIDDVLVGNTPLRHPLHLLPGRHRLTVRRAGYEPDERELQLAKGSAPAIDLQLQVRVTQRPSESRSRWLVKRWWFWSAIGVVVTAVVIGGAVGGSQPGLPESKLGTICPWQSGGCH
jgi:tetratricopeptide (TPR) repeat protein